MVGRRKSNLNLPPRMYQKHGAYYYVTKENKWIRLSNNLAEAKAKWIEIEGEVPLTDTVAGLIDRYLVEVAPKKAPRTYQDNLTEAKQLIAVFGHMRPSEVRPMHVAQYLDVRGRKAPTRANREKSLLSHVYSIAMRWGVVDFNPCRGVARNPEKGRDRYITDAEFNAVKKLAGNFIAAVMEFAYITAARRGDILNLRLDQLAQEGIYIKQGKTGAKQLFEWSPGLRSVVESAKALPRPVRGLYLFCNRRGQPYTDSGFKAMWNRVQVKWAEEGGERFTFHDIRAKALTDAQHQGMDAQAMAGHSSSAMTEHYIKQREFKKVRPLR
ncbi:MAG: tyrosine-type recombinase/integrase [Sulfuricella sp.]